MTKIDFELGLLGPNWKHHHWSNGHKGPDGIYIRRATKLDRFYAVFQNGKFVSRHNSIGKAGEVAKGLLQ